MTKPKTANKLYLEDEPIIPPPSTMTVVSDKPPVLYNSAGVPLKRKVGF